MKIPINAMSLRRIADLLAALPLILCVSCAGKETIRDDVFENPVILKYENTSVYFHEGLYYYITNDAGRLNLFVNADPTQLERTRTLHGLPGQGAVRAAAHLASPDREHPGKMVCLFERRRRQHGQPSDIRARKSGEGPPQRNPSRCADGSKPTRTTTGPSTPTSSNTTGNST